MGCCTILISYYDSAHIKETYCPFLMAIPACADAKMDIQYVHGAKCIEDVSKDLEAYLQTSSVEFIMP